MSRIYQGGSKYQEYIQEEASIKKYQRYIRRRQISRICKGGGKYQEISRIYLEGGKYQENVTQKISRKSPTKENINKKIKKYQEISRIYLGGGKYQENVTLKISRNIKKIFHKSKYQQISRKYTFFSQHNRYWHPGI